MLINNYVFLDGKLFGYIDWQSQKKETAKVCRLEGCCIETTDGSKYTLDPPSQTVLAAISRYLGIDHG